jgi:hypothetical protein
MRLRTHPARPGTGATARRKGAGGAVPNRFGSARSSFRIAYNRAPGLIPPLAVVLMRGCAAPFESAGFIQTTAQGM